MALAIATPMTADEPGLANSLRAVRLDAVTRAIGARFAEPDISPSAIGATMGLSVRYVHHILQETGISFSERVLELRLARALSLLIGHEGHSLRVSDAALAAGFSDLSYFNRCFRRRYGVTPTTARGA